MLTVILLFVILEGIIHLIDIPFKKKIKNSTSVDTSLKSRSNLKTARLISTPLLIILACAGIIWLSVENDAVDTLGRDLGLIIAYAITRGWSMLKGNIQTFSKEGYLSKHHDNYVFYLRAFESDFYSTSRNAYTLESGLAKAIKKKGWPISAIGMTKELDAPPGASRIYVDDETWQADVLELMQHARMIFILMSDRESCIWEISKSAKMLSKICFIIDNTDKYENIKNSISNTIKFPDLNTLLGKLDNKISKKDIADGISCIGFMMDDKNLDVFDFNCINSPKKISNKLDGVKQIVKLLKK